jgi:hypothetical protein
MKIRSNRKNSVTAAETSDTGILSKIKNYVKKLYDINYGGSADFSNLNKVPVAVAYDGHTDNALGQIVLDLNKYRIVYEENGKAKNVIRKYNSLAEMWDALQNMDFDDYQNFLVYDTVESSTMYKPMRKTIKASASAKRRASQRVNAAKSLNMKAGIGRKSDWILRGYTVNGEDVDIALVKHGTLLQVVERDIKTRRVFARDLLQLDGDGLSLLHVALDGLMVVGMAHLTTHEVRRLLKPDGGSRDGVLHRVPLTGHLVLELCSGGHCRVAAVVA